MTTDIDSGCGMELLHLRTQAVHGPARPRNPPLDRLAAGWADIGGGLVAHLIRALGARDQRHRGSGLRVLIGPTTPVTQNVAGQPRASYRVSGRSLARHAHRDGADAHPRVEPAVQDDERPAPWLESRRAKPRQAVRSVRRRSSMESIDRSQVVTRRTLARDPARGPARIRWPLRR